ncbi:MAG: CBS domain-containing protein [Candidatus Binatia bacterium]
MEAEQLLCQTFLAAHPEDAARILEGLAPAESAALLGESPTAVATSVLQCMNPLSAAECLTKIPDESIGILIAGLPVDVVARLLRYLAPGVQEQLLVQAPDETAAQLRTLVQYPEESAGALMDPQMLALPDDITVSDTLERIRLTPHRVFSYLYVVDRAQVLVGVVNLRELMLAAPEVRLATVMRSHVARIDAQADRPTILAHPGWRQFHSLPVVDAAGTFLGVLRYQTRQQLEAESSTERQTRNAVATFLSLGEAYWVGVSQMLGGLVSVLAPVSSRLPETQRNRDDA